MPVMMWIFYLSEVQMVQLSPAKVWAYRWLPALPLRQTE